MCLSKSSSKMKYYNTTKVDLTEQVMFENTLLRNGLTSPSLEEKFANIYDDTMRDTIEEIDDSMLNPISIYSTSDLIYTDVLNEPESNTNIDTFEDKNSTAENTIGNVCVCTY